MVKQIPMGGKKGEGKFVLVDDDMYEELSQYKWHLSSHGYARTASRETIEKLGHRLMHRYINQTPDGMDTDHIDHDRLNNQRSNLRTTSHRQNMMNMSLHKYEMASPYKGVSWSDAANMWVGKIRVKGVSKHLGCFQTQKEAADAYDKAAIQYFGAHAHLNNAPVDNVNDAPIVNDKPFKKLGGSSEYTGVTAVPSGSYSVCLRVNERSTPIGNFPDEKFAARIYDAALVVKYGQDALRRMNFPERINEPLSLNVRYVFRAKPTQGAEYAGVSKWRAGRTFRYTHFRLDDKLKQYPFPTAIEAAEHYDKLVLIHRENICTLLNFPERLADYLAEIGDQIISPKPIIIPDLD